MRECRARQGLTRKTRARPTLPWRVAEAIGGGHCFTGSSFILAIVAVVIAIVAIAVVDVGMGERVGGGGGSR